MRLTRSFRSCPWPVLRRLRANDTGALLISGSPRSMRRRRGIGGRHSCEAPRAARCRWRCPRRSSSPRMAGPRHGRRATRCGSRARRGVRGSRTCTRRGSSTCSSYRSMPNRAGTFFMRSYAIVRATSSSTTWARGRTSRVSRSGPTAQTCPIFFAPTSLSSLGSPSGGLAAREATMVCRRPARTSRRAPSHSLPSTESRKRSRHGPIRIARKQARGRATSSAWVSSFGRRSQTPFSPARGGRCLTTRAATITL